MSDRYRDLVNHPWGASVAKRLGLPSPVPLRRYTPGQQLVDGPALLGSAGSSGHDQSSRLLGPVTKMLQSAGVDIRAAEPPDTDEDRPDRHAALVFDATGLRTSEDLHALYAFFRPVLRSLDSCGRVVVLGTPPESCADARYAVAQRALEGFVRSVAKEITRGSTAQLVYVAEGAEGALESTLRFLLSARSAFVSGQVIRVGVPADGDDAPPQDWERPLDGKVAVVTGAARGIGAATAETLARDGAQVVCLDVAAAGDALAETANRIGGEALTLDITAGGAPGRLVTYLRERHGGVDVLVHNAGITRDRTLPRMKPERWDAVLAVNLTAPEMLTAAVLDAGVLRAGGRIVCVSSVGGIAGNRGQTNYATSKAGVIGFVTATAPALADRTATINAVAPGFIETGMTKAMPALPKEAGRRLSSLAQGGLPIDVAETISWLAGTGSGGLTGQVVRVCGQSLLGA